MSCAIHTLDDSLFAKWDAYVERAPGATFFHRVGWKTVLERAFGHQTYFLYATDDDDVVGILPLALVKSRIFGTTLCSTPFCVYGGIVADSEEAAAALRERACALADELAVDALELRNAVASESGWPVKELYYTFRKEIGPDEEANLKAIPNRQRAMIRKGIAEGLASDFDTGVDRLYRVYSESVRNLGTPVFSKRYLSVLREVFASDCDTLMISQGGDDVAAVMSFYFRDEVIPYYGGSTAKARTIKGVNHFMYWELMRSASERGCRLFDFGRSKAGTGPYSFKKNFGFTAEPLPYEYYLVGSSSVPDVNPLNPKYRLMIEAWSRLPLPIANRLGPLLARSLG